MAIETVSVLPRRTDHHRLYRIFSLIPEGCPGGHQQLSSGTAHSFESSDNPLDDNHPQRMLCRAPGNHRAPISELAVVAAVGAVGRVKTRSIQKNFIEGAPCASYG